MSDPILATVPELRVHAEIEVPVLVLRWTHAGINSHLAFWDEHNHAKEIFLNLYIEKKQNKLLKSKKIK